MATPFSQYILDNYKKEDLVGVEVGVMRGINALYILQDLPIKKLYLVDNYKPYFDYGSEHYTQEQMNQFYADALLAVDPHKNNIEFIIKDSVEACNNFSDGELDFIYIDAGHSYDEVYNDLLAWWPKVKSGGIFGGHDYGTVNGSAVKLAIDNFLKFKEILIKDPSVGIRVGEAMEWAIIKN